MTKDQAEQFVGQTFGLLTVTGVVGFRAPRGGKRKMMYVTCDCACGRKDHVVQLDSIRYGRSISCGCARSNSHRSSVFGGHLASKTKETKFVPVERTLLGLEGLGFDLSVSRISKYWQNLPKEEMCSAWQDVRKFADWAIRNGFTKDRELKRRDQTKLLNPINCYWG